MADDENPEDWTPTRVQLLWAARFIVERLAEQVGKPWDGKGVGRMLAWLTDHAADDAMQAGLFDDDLTSEGVGPAPMESDKPNPAVVVKILKRINDAIARIAGPST